MPIKFSGTKADLPNADQTISREKTFLSTIIGDISSNNTSYFKDICVNQISDIAGQVLTIDCSLNVLGNISYKDTTAPNNEQDLLAIIADLSGKLHDLSGQVNTWSGEPDLSMTLINIAVSADIIEPNGITCQDISCNYITCGYRLRVGTSTNNANRTNIASSNGGSHFIQANTGYRGYLENFNVRIHSSKGTYSNQSTSWGTAKLCKGPLVQTNNINATINRWKRTDD